MTGSKLHAGLACAAVAAAFAAVPSSAAVCDITPQGVGFGAYDTSETGDLDGVGTIAIDCDGEVSVAISLSAGTGSYAARVMTGGADPLHYNLFTTAQRAIVWGDGSGGSGTVSATLQSREFTVYGTIPGRQRVTAGAYSDTIVVTIAY